MRIIFLNRFYWPDELATAQLLTDLATALAAAGHSVTVIAACPARRNTARSETRDAVVIERVQTTAWGRTNLAGRCFDFATYYVGALWRLLWLTRRGDVVIALTDPPLIGLAAWPLARLHGAKMIHWVHDIYPEIAAEILGHRWLLALRPFRDWAWRHADACVVPGQDMIRVLTEAGVSVSKALVSPNWAPFGIAPAPAADVAALRKEWGIDRKFVVAYSGNLGRLHDLDPLLDVAEAMRGDPDVVFLIIGNGAQRAPLTGRAQSRGLDHVQFRPPQPRGRLAVTLNVADVHFVTLRAGAERLVFPSKFYGAAAVGRPVIFIGSRNCELARLVKAHGLGAAFTRDDLAPIVATLRRWRDDPNQHASMSSSALQFSPNAFATAVAFWTNLVSAPRVASACATNSLA